jgi:hypothetical protein
MKGSAVDPAEAGASGTFTAPRSLPKSGDWMGTISGYGDAHYFSLTGQANRTLAVEVTTLDETGQPALNKAHRGGGHNHHHGHARARFLHATKIGASLDQRHFFGKGSGLALAKGVGRAGGDDRRALHRAAAGKWDPAERADSELANRHRLGHAQPG